MHMFMIIVTLVLGILIGRLNLIPERFAYLTQWITTGGLIVLLVSMGAGISSNPEVLSRVGQLGIQAFLLALFSVIGSILLVLIIQKWVTSPEPSKGAETE